jgi:hypothetical protein
MGNLDGTLKWARKDCHAVSMDVTPQMCIFRYMVESITRVSIGAGAEQVFPRILHCFQEDWLDLAPSIAPPDDVTRSIMGGLGCLASKHVCINHHRGESGGTGINNKGQTIHPCLRACWEARLTGENGEYQIADMFPPKDLRTTLRDTLRIHSNCALATALARRQLIC